MALSIASVFGSQEEPMVNEKLGAFQKIAIPVSMGMPLAWHIRPDDVDYLIAQDDKEHNDLLNKYYAQRRTNPMWKELGRIAEREAAHFNDKDTSLRKNIGAKSSWIKGVEYDPERQLVFLDFGGKQYKYAATPAQFKEFMSRGSLGAQITPIRMGKLTGSLQRIDVGRQSRPRIDKMYRGK